MTFTIAWVVGWTILAWGLGYLHARSYRKRFDRELRKQREELKTLAKLFRDLTRIMVNRAGSALMQNFALNYGGRARPVGESPPPGETEEASDSDETQDRRIEELFGLGPIDTDDDSADGYMEPADDLNTEFTDRDFPPRSLPEGFYSPSTTVSLGGYTLQAEQFYHLSALDGSVRWVEQVGEGEAGNPARYILTIVEQWAWHDALEAGRLMYIMSSDQMHTNFRRVADGLNHIGPALAESMNGMVTTMQQFTRHLRNNPALVNCRIVHKTVPVIEKEPPTRFERLLNDDGCMDPPE